MCNFIRENLLIHPRIIKDVDSYVKEIISTVSNPNKIEQWDRVTRTRLISCIISGIDTMLHIEMNVYPSLQQNPSPKLDEMRAIRMELAEWKKIL